MKKIITSFILAGVLFGVFSPSLIAEAATKLTVTTDVLRVREKPSTTSKILGKITKGAVYTSNGTSGNRPQNRCLPTQKATKTTPAEASLT